ncbi:outer membrane beta-barrel protein [Lutibacter sp.]|uniref:outer membrane beta-barrel protein n=1 Tax=Lutibacter sp. TaxID=1925666 RepID=UPI001A32DE97|nr:outer membrane beta-barrel protein [Lutibacter sp.]MBI9039807.1 outer membrane beta-barrel protein [Lutibacter sp.]
MKKHLLLLVAFIIATSASAQFYVSASGGYSISSAGILTGTSLNDSQTTATNHYGSYGEGMTAQLRVGKMFNEMFGAELGFAYLHGADQNISSYLTNDSGSIKEFTDGSAHARAYGLTASLIYNFNDNLYGKIGMVTKLGGKTEAEFTRSTVTPLSAFGVAPIMTEGINDYHGRPPLGFTAAFGYKHDLGGNWGIFAELEYLGINVTRDYSEFAELTITTPATPALPAGAIGPNAVPAIPSMTWNLGDAPLNHPIFGTIAAPSKVTYEDSLPQPNNDPSKSLSSVAPYSSFGLNVGITYTFSKK